MIDLAGRFLGQYQLVHVIRRGGMSTIYKAYQPSLERYVAVKVLLHPQDSQFVLRFKREARAIAQLQHPNILTIYDYGEEDGLLFLVMQYIENGRTLQDLLQKPMDTVVALRIAVRVLDALEYAHSQGIIHRDLKPSNILMLSPIWPMLSDFGIAKLVNDKERLTMPGLLLGTPAYIAPEQAIGRAIDARTDIYSAGVVLFEMLTGNIPFDAPDPLIVLSKHAFEEPPSVRERNPALSPEVDRILMRALAKDPAARFQSAAEMGEALEDVVQAIEQSRLLSQHANFYLAGVQAIEKERWDLAVEHLSRVGENDPHYSTATALLRRALDELARRAAERDQSAKEAAPTAEALAVASSTAPPALPEVQPPGEPAAAPQAPAESEPVPAPTETRSPAEPPAALERPEPPASDAPPEPFKVPTTAKLGDVAEQAALNRAVEQPAVAEAQPLPAEPAPAASKEQAALLAAAASRRKRLRTIAAAALLVAVAVALALSRVYQLWPDQRVAAEMPTATSVVATPSPTEAPQSTSTQAAAAQSPAPPAGTLIFEDDLSQGTSRIRLAEQINDPNFSRGVHAPGIYHFMLANPGDTRWQLLPGFAVGDFTLELQLWDNSDNFAGGVAQGVIWRAADMSHFYTLLIDSRQGRFSVRKLNGENQWRELQPWQESGLILRGDQVNRVRVDARGNAFVIYINDQLLSSFSSDIYSFGMIGLIVANEDAVSPHIHFDNIKVWHADPPPPPEQHEPTRQHPSGDMVLIAGGDFVMGSNERSDEAPHVLSLPAFYIDRTEVTNAAYQRCVEAGACAPQSSFSSQSHPSYALQADYANFPVLYVSWRQAEQFCTWAGKRLPSEAEWEKAASWDAGQQVKLLWPWGNEFDSSRLNSLESGVVDTVAVDRFAEEVNHTLGMAGNVWEWTSSLYRPYPYNPDDGREEPQTSGNRVLRGGSWSQTKGKVQTTIRMFAAENYNDREIGFRCAANP